MLFPFLDLELSIEAAQEVHPQDPAPAQTHGLTFIRTISTRPGGALPRLRLTQTQLQTIVDVSWSRRDRWNAFRSIRKLADGYHPDEGALPWVLRTYVDADLLQPFYDSTIRDPRFWTQLGIAADHADFIQFITAYADRHPSTKTTTELLFLLDKLAQGSFDTLTLLLDTDPHDLRWTVQANLDAYLLIRGIRAHYVDRLGQLAANRKALRAKYDAVRLKILQAILRTTPHEYRANDARFEIGAIAWRAGDRQAAMRTWRELRSRPGDYYASSSSYILAVLRERGPDAPLPAEAAARIAKILENEHTRWEGYATNRLRRFGYTPDRF